VREIEIEAPQLNGTSIEPYSLNRALIEPYSLNGALIGAGDRDRGAAGGKIKNKK
jgi:hypothetical protein